MCFICSRSSKLTFQSNKRNLPPGATRLGIGLSSDATLLTSGTGDLSAWPLLITLDNIDPAVRRKSSNHSYMLLALLPKVRFIESNKDTSRTLRDRVFHTCLRIACAPLREIARHGKEMSDPKGQLRWCFTPISMYTVDLPEAMKLACVTQNCYPTTLATKEEFGSTHRKEPRAWSLNREKIDNLARRFDPVRELPEFAKAAAKENMTGVTESIWDGWDNSDPSIAITFDLLHGGL